MTGYVSRHLRVFVLDDHDIVRRGLLDLLTKRDIEVVGDAGSAERAAEQILELRPDVMVLDVQLPDGSGVQVCRDVRSADPSIRGLLLTSAEDRQAKALSLLAGADGAIVKLAGTSDIIEAVRRVGAWRAPPGSAATEQTAGDLRARAANLHPPLTPEQADMLASVLSGNTDQQIAAQRRQPLAEIRDQVSLIITRIMSGAGKL
jgi:two-component system response regulator DevR